MLSSQNVNLPNVNNKMKPRQLGPFQITNVNYQGNNYTLELTRNFDLHHIHNTFHIGLWQSYRENNQEVFPQRHYAPPGLVTDDRYEVEKAVIFRFSHPAREPLQQIRWKGYLPSDDRWIHNDKIAEEVKFRFWQAEDLKPTFQRRRCHRGRSESRKRSETLSNMQVERDRVMQSIMITSSMQLVELLADQLFNLLRGN